MTHPYLSDPDKPALSPQIREAKDKLEPMLGMAFSTSPAQVAEVPSAQSLWHRTPVFIPSPPICSECTLGDRKYDRMRPLILIQ